MLPFTTEEFLDVFGRYNQAILPMQTVAYGLGFAAVLLALRPGRCPSPARPAACPTAGPCAARR